MQAEERIFIMRKIIAILLLSCTLLLLCSCAQKSANADTSGKDGMKMEELFQKKCSAEEALELSRKSDTVVLEDLTCTSGKEVWDAFYKSASSGKPASVLCAFYYTLDKEGVSEELYEQEKDLYPQLFFMLVEFDGKEYSVKVRQSSEEKPEKEETYQYLKHYTGDAPSTATYSTYEYFVLVDDDSLTWEDIEMGLFSSQYGAMKKHCTVFENCK